MSARPKTRDVIVEAADRLFYQQGFEHTSFAHISEMVQISRGNLYHHFKTKDEILTAVIALRKVRTQEILDQWEHASNVPLERIKSFFSFFTFNREKIKAYGCPLGTLSHEMRKLNHMAKEDSVQLFVLFRTWIGRQFELLGYTKDEADALSMHLLSQSQGIATLFSAFQDEAFVERELTRIYEWLGSLQA